MSWTCLFVYVIIHIRRQIIAEKIFAEVISPADFTLLIRNIPSNAKKQDILAWIEENGTLRHDKPKIHKICLVYDSRKFREYEIKYNEWRINYETAPEEETLM